MDSWLLKLLSRDMKTKANKQRLTSKQSKNNRKIKDRKNKAMGNMTPIMDYYPRNGWMRDTNP